MFTRVVSLPSWNLFAEQSAAYREQIFPHGIPIVVVEAGVSLGWKPYVGTGVEVVGVDRFGASAPGEVVMNEYGFTVEDICNRVLHVLNKEEH